MRTNKFWLTITGCVLIFGIISAQTSELPACCKAKGSAELCCKKTADVNQHSGCKAKGGSEKGCAKGKQNVETASLEGNPDIKEDSSAPPACCAQNANQKRSFWDKLIGRNKNHKSCSTKQK